MCPTPSPSPMTIIPHWHPFLWPQCCPPPLTQLGMLDSLPVEVSCKRARAPNAGAAGGEYDAVVGVLCPGVLGVGVWPHACSASLLGRGALLHQAAGTQVVVTPNLPLPQFSKPEPQPPLPHPRSGHSQYPSPRGHLLSAFPGEGGECSQQSVPSWRLLLEVLH